MFIPFIDFPVRWYDVLDLVILTLVLYYLITLIKGTKSLQIFYGFLLLGLLWLVAFNLRLGGVSLILNNFFQSLVIIAVVIFQDDIRNALSSAWQPRFSNKVEKQKVLRVVDSIVYTCERLAREKTGAIIVFERGINLKSYTRSGSELHADVSSSLLLSLFNKNSLLHDGALIIDRNLQILSAGSILPVKSDISLPYMYGTRHRAACSLSLETDAVLLVVSEERGEISLIKKGEFIQITTDLRDKLLEILLIS